MMCFQWIRELRENGLKNCVYRSALITLFSTILYIVPSVVYGLNTTAGTSIDNSCSITYYSQTIAPDSLTKISNIASTTVVQSESVAIELRTESATLIIGDTTYVAKVVTNLGNAPDSFTLSGTNTEGYTVTFTRDDNQDGVHQAGETTIITSLQNIAADTSKTFSETFFVSVYVPPGSPVNPYVPITISATSQSDLEIADTVTIYGRTLAASLPTYINIAMTLTDDPDSNELDISLQIIDGSNGNPVYIDNIAATITVLTSGYAVTNADTLTLGGKVNFSLTPLMSTSRTAFISITIDSVAVFGVVPIRRSRYIVAAPGGINHVILAPASEVKSSDRLYIPETDEETERSTTLASNLLKSNYALTPVITESYNPVRKFVSSTSEYKSDVRLVIPYNDSNQDGIVDGTNVLERTLKGYRYDPLTGYYDLAPGAQVDVVNNLVYLPVTELGIFTLLGSPTENNISKSVSYPNPFFITDPNFNEGRRYITINTFTTNHTYLKVKLYNIAGEIVRVLDDPPFEIDIQNGIARWDGRNDVAQYVTRGIYFFIIESDKGTASGKITVVE